MRRNCVASSVEAPRLASCRSKPAIFSVSASEAPLGITGNACLKDYACLEAEKLIYSASDAERDNGYWVCCQCCGEMN